MTTLEPEQWRVLGRLKYLCGERAQLHSMLKAQDVSPESVCDLAERGLIVAKLDGEQIDLTPGLIKTYRRKMFLYLSPAGEAYYWNDPHRVLRVVGRFRHGVTLPHLLGMVLFDDVAKLAREGMIHALTEDDPIDLGDAHQRWANSAKLVLPGGAELWINAVTVRATRAGQLYCERN
ncbi:hypothetical protein GCM10010435_65970 [Winogradskya consettensis]|uniref:Uncharacterized protein n=1 Tax=Winogradskya consettensis TaxID=113560 RepID=A0A919T203_9ACTN|nr:hypothetical protein [Actinoplanes consettensis]GIM84779.1 hypothetical protein Aco04nite_93110 [Actinoplanes consettensis]